MGTHLCIQTWPGHFGLFPEQCAGGMVELKRHSYERLLRLRSQMGLTWSKSLPWSLNFLICKMGMKAPVSQSYGGSKVA